MRTLIGLLAVAASCLAPAAAQAVSGLHVIVDELSRDALACGIEEASIESAAAGALREHGIRVVAELASPYSYLYIAAKVGLLGNAGNASLHCVVHARVEVIDVAPTQAPVGGFKGLKSRRGTTEAVQCSSSVTSTGPAADLRRDFAGKLEQTIQRCLANMT